MATVLLVLVVVLVIAALVFGVVTLLSGDDPGLGAVEPDGRALALPNHRSLTETDLKTVRFDVELRGYRMAQVDRVLRRTAYDVGYKDEMIAVLEAEVVALREGRLEDAELLRKARESAAGPAPGAMSQAGDDAPGYQTTPDSSDDPTDEEAALANDQGMQASNSHEMDSEPGDSEPGDSEPGDSEPGDSEPGDGEPGESEPGDGEPGSEPGDGEPGESDHGNTDPGASHYQDGGNRGDVDRDRTYEDVEHRENENRLDQDEPQLTEDPHVQPTGEVDMPEERAARG